MKTFEEYWIGFEQKTYGISVEEAKEDHKKGLNAPVVFKAAMMWAKQVQEEQVKLCASAASGVRYADPKGEDGSTWISGWVKVNKDLIYNAPRALP